MLLYINTPLLLNYTGIPGVSFEAGAWISLCKHIQISYGVHSIQQNIKFHKSHSVGTEFLHADRQTDKQTDIMKLRVAFHNFVNMPKNC
jgi:hypothetical protein